MKQIPEPNQAAPIGAFVRMHLPQILAYCQKNPQEFRNLQGKTYCLATFRQSYPVLAPRVSETTPLRYWAAKSSTPFFEAGYWVTREWRTSLHTAHFVMYLVRLGIEPIGVDEDFLSWAADYVDDFGTTGSAPGGPRYRATPIGTVQNDLVRHLLGSLGYEAFTEADWVQVKSADFVGACAYCGVVGPTQMDHAVPISREHQGEHRRGNLIPACARCNGKKSQQHYVAFLRRWHRLDPAQAAARIAAAEGHASKHGYQPIEDLEGVRPLLEEARAAVRALADDYRNRINMRLGYDLEGEATAPAPPEA